MDVAETASPATLTAPSDPPFSDAELLYHCSTRAGHTNYFLEAPGLTGSAGAFE
jgi:hypothetical protein